MARDAQPTTSRSVTSIIRANVFTPFNALLGGLCAAVLATGSWPDAAFGLVVVINTLIGIGQELRAKATLDRLALLTATAVHIERDGRRLELPRAEVAVGDVQLLTRGDQVVGDGEVVGSEALEADESLLTGESEPVPKPEGSALLAGAAVVAGEGRLRIERVGADSYAAKLAAEGKAFAVTRSEVVTEVNRLLVWISWSLLLIGPVLLWSQWRATHSWQHAITGATAGIVGMVPEGLVLLTSIAFLLGAAALARKNVLAQELAAVEGLARVDVVCLDKTGTLTDGTMEFAELVPLSEGADAPAVLGALAAHSTPNPTTVAIGAAFAEPKGWTPVERVAFSSARKWSGVDFGADGVWVLGAPDILLPESQPAEAVARTEQGERVLLLARVTALGDGSGAPEGLAPVALAVLRERLREDAAATLDYLHRQGVRTMIVSGDHPVTLRAVAAKFGISGDDVVGRATPHQKRDIVRSLQADGHTVGMTGDGVNDILALKAADIGIAMGSGSPATRAVAQLVLVDDRFAHVPDVIDEGRRAMANVERVANLFLIKNVYSLLLSLLVAVAAVQYPFVPRQLTVISALTIGIPAFALTFGRSAPPYRPGFLRRVLSFAVPVGVLVGVAGMASYSYGRHLTGSTEVARTSASATVIVAGLAVLLLLARPLNGWKVALVAALAALFAGGLAVPGIREFLALDVEPRSLGAGLILGAAVGLGAWPVWRWAQRTAPHGE